MATDTADKYPWVLCLTAVLMRTAFSLGISTHGYFILGSSTHEYFTIGPQYSWILLFFLEGWVLMDTALLLTCSIHGVSTMQQLYITIQYHI